VLVLVAVARMGIAALRFRILIAHRAAISLGELTRQYFVGAYFNNLLPTSIGGDAARIMMLGRCNLAKSEAAAYVLVERLLGAVALVLLALVGTFIFRVAGEIRLLVDGMAVSASVGIGLCLVGRHRLGAMVSADTVKGRAVGAALTILVRPAALGLGFLLWIVFQLTSVALSYLMALALDITLSFSGCVALVPLVWLVTLLPVSIGGVGLRDAAFALLLGTAGIAKEESILISLGTYTALLFTGAVGGIILVQNDMAGLFAGRRQTRYKANRV
jgi:uncharacterized membrane protein YbhN (UPF0104 family)